MCGWPYTDPAEAVRFGVEIDMENWELSRKTAAALICVGVLFLSALFCMGEKREFSEQENRYLTGLPEFTWESLRAGEYTAELERYLADHFPFRDFFVGLKTGFELGIGNKEINGVYIAEDGYLIEKYKKPENTQKIIRAFQGLQAATEAEVYLMLVPTASVIYSDKLPKNAPMESQIDAMSDIYEGAGCRPVHLLGPLGLLRDGEEPLFYRTDHHWTSYAAYAAYREFCRVRGFEPVELDSLQKKVVTEDFKGTVYSKVNDYSHAGDSIIIYENPEQRLEVCYRDTGEVTDSLYNYEYLEKKDKYSFFLNNIHPLVEITNEEASTDSVLVLIKDSYANCIVPFLANHYRKLYVVDPRYYKEPVSELINANAAEALILYNMNTIDTDLGIGGIY